ncbi:hypothetical protein HMPREF1980_01684 [Actinomyces sp. oral taxon 172 str. F0311]|nr:hypothetical protein HMPREF1980_01684 [Actinomyces sp. oral taxon 172 str. F0311]
MHADGHVFTGAVKFIPGVLRAHTFRLSEKTGRGSCGTRDVWGGMRGIRLVS